MAVTKNLTLHRYPASNTGYVEDLGDGVTLTLMQIPAGEFLMGSAADDSEARDDERPQHRVTMPRFFMGQTPVTQAQWRVVAGYEAVDMELKSDPSQFKGDDLPVEQVSWDEATEFCQRLTQELMRRRAPKDPVVYRLPSEAEWEYACRAGTTTAYHYGDRITPELANYERSIGQTSAVKTYPPNLWGLYDLHGNVWEWCADPWHDNYEGAPSDGSVWTEGGSSTRRVRRGGSWYYHPRDCRSAFRRIYSRDGRDYDLGFRVCCSAPRALQ